MRYMNIGIIIFLFAWKYSKGKKYIKKILLIYAFLYTLQGLVFGDRSAGFPMILLVFLLIYNKGIKMQYVVLVGFAGIILANFIDIFRNNGLISYKYLIDALFDRGLFVNTLSYSFYGGTQIIRFSETVTNQYTHLINYIMAIFLGRK